MCIRDSFNGDDAKVTATCKVKNVGACLGTEVVQMYVGFSHSKVDRPVKVLRGFTRVELQAGEAKLAKIACKIEKIAYYDPYTRQMTVEKMEYELYIGTSEADCVLIKGNVQI